MFFVYSSFLNWKNSEKYEYIQLKTDHQKNRSLFLW